MQSICKDIHSSPELIAYIFEKKWGFLAFSQKKEVSLQHE